MRHTPLNPATFEPSTPKRLRPRFSVLAFLALGSATVALCSVDAFAAPEPGPATSPKLAAFVGRWDLTFKSETAEFPSWIEIRESSTRPEALFVGRWGHARPLPRVEIENGAILFVSPKEEEGSKTDLVFRGHLTETTDHGKPVPELKGSAEGPDGVPWTWTGVRAPALKPPPSPKWGKPVQLFNGKDFTGWKFDKPGKASSWKVENGSLVNAGAGANMVTTGRFQDFKLHVEVNCPAHANSGIYLRGRYEVQVEDDSIAEPSSHHMGAVYGFLVPTPEQPRRPGTWQTFDITLLGRYVTVAQNGQTIIDDQEIPGITGGAKDSHEGQPGPIYLQGDHGGIAYRNITLTPVSY